MQRKTLAFRPTTHNAVSGSHGHGRLAVARHPRRTDTFKRVAETGPRLMASVPGKGRLSLTGFLPEV